MAKVKSSLWMPNGRHIICDLDEHDFLLPNFQVYEIANMSSSAEIKLEIPDALAWTFLTMLQITRDKYGKMVMNSVYRTEEFNSRPEVGGDPNSCHLNCRAFDTPTAVAIDWWRNLCREFHVIGAINLYDKYRHCEIGSDINYGLTEFKVRDHRSKKI